jgi:FtsP/CotA-like multicopper oxidase with cupredoxin domain
MSAINRRQLLAGAAALPLLTGADAFAAVDTTATLKAAPVLQAIVAGKPAALWAFNGVSPGPILRASQGQPFRQRFVNGLDQPSTVHWHGIRIDNAMDGVGGMTQAAVRPGAYFDYAFTPPDAGTFWYHPHEKSYEQVPRGLYGALIVAEAAPPFADQDLSLVISDWRLNAEGALLAGFGARHDQIHAGRLGNTITVNGVVVPDIPVRKNERLRLRLINAATARIVSLRLDGMDPRLIAFDGQPVAPTSNGYGSSLVLGPGNRVDVMVDVLAERGSILPLVDLRFGQAEILARLVVHPELTARHAPVVAPIALLANPLAMPQQSKATQVDLVMTGGGQGEHDMALMHGSAAVWSLNGKAGTNDHAAMMHDAPLFRARRGETVALKIDNRTAWPHAMHLHGHHFRLWERIDGPTPEPFWWDTLVIEPGEIASIAFVAGNPGTWMLHCHMLDHQASGMMSWFEVA